MLKKDQIPKVELEEMNVVHYEEVELLITLLNRLDAVADGELAPETIDTSLETLIEHMRAHFAREEQQMVGAGFPAHPAHKAEHDRVLAEARSIYDAWRSDRDERTLARYLERTLPAWMIHHITTLDADAARFLAARGPRRAGAGAATAETET
ncbi:hemerythrin [Sulfurifustis variabilis]|uniref:Hemerythrin n=1 Tax=Sulfurifustis variabilis TaxID=1675686 RepID=A0A1B4VER9_9GAMM|nr:hemerythrin family protein [Sulfurifustis variabilis]BAU49187.1 hemerythrin [Sulfurifustis variabilis]